MRMTDNDVRLMDNFLVTCRLRCEPGGYLSGDDLRVLLVDHPNPEHMVEKYRQHPWFIDFLDRLDPKTAGMFFDNELLEQDCLPPHYTEFRRWLEENNMLSAWLHGVDADHPIGMMTWERRNLLNFWHDHFGQFISSPRFDLWDTIMPRTTPARKQVGKTEVEPASPMEADNVGR